MWETMMQAFLLSEALEFCLKCETSLFQLSIFTVPFSTKCKYLFSGDHFVLLHLGLESACAWAVCLCLCHWCSVLDHAGSSWSSNGCKCCGVHAAVFMHFVFSLCGVPGGEWQSSSVLSLWEIHSAYCECSSTLSWLVLWGTLQHTHEA